ncbi:unnamed protein product [Arabidopsis lyrata]|nr:unnamed protein product [Arabidopsis lyrata]
MQIPFTKLAQLTDEFVHNLCIPSPFCSSSSPLESIFLNRFSASFLFFADHLSAIFCLQCACKK